MNYETWRATFQSSELAAKAAFAGEQHQHQMLLKAVAERNEIEQERDALAAHVDRLRKAMTIATETHIAFAKRMALGANATSMLAVDKADELLVREAYHVPIDLSCLARRDAISHSEGMNKAALFIEQKANSYDVEHGKTDPSTNHREYPGDGAEYYNDLMELAEELRLQAGGDAQ